jgi:hypothetical protein
MSKDKSWKSGKKTVDFKAIGSIVFDAENLARTQDLGKARRKKRRIFKALAKKRRR